MPWSQTPATASSRSAGAALVALAVPVVAVVVTGVLCWLVAGRFLFDLSVYRHGGRAVLDGRDLYRFRDEGYGFTYPPFAALAFAPLAWLSQRGASWTMTVLSLACLAVFARLSLPEWSARLRDRPSVPALLGGAALLLCLPVVETLQHGQINLVLGAVVMLDALVLRRGVLIGLASAIKLTPGIFVLYLALRGRWRECAGAALAFAAVSALAALIRPADSRQYWTRTVFDGSGIGDPARPTDQSLRGLADRLVGVHAGGPVWVVLAVPVLAVGLIVAARLARTGREPFALGVVGVTGCLVSPVSWAHHWIWCVPVLGGLWAIAEQRGAWARVGVLACGAVFVTQWLSPARLTSYGGPWTVVLDNSYVLAGLAMLVAGALHSSGSSARLGLALG